MLASDVVLGDKLALLTLSAAEEVDLRLKGRPPRAEILEDLGRALSRAWGVGESQATAFLQSDPTTTEVFAKAAGEAWNEPVEDISALTAAMRKIIDPLVQDGVPLTESDLRAVKTFCLTLHRAMTAQMVPPIYERENPVEDEIGLAR